MNDSSRYRKNLLNLPRENWRPPSYSNRGGLWQGFRNGLNRFFDLQAGSIWADLSYELPKIQGTVLDVGCGLQPFRRLFTRRVKYIGLDTIDSKAHFGYEAPDTLYFSGDIWPVKNKTADFILCTETLEHIPEPAVFLKEAHRTLKPGGRILLTVPFCARWHFIPYDYWRHTPSGLARLLEGVGFTGVCVHARGNQLTVACYKVMAFIFTLLFPTKAHFLGKNGSRLLGVLTIPLLVATAALANLTKGIDGMVDCLGYTVLADRPMPNHTKRRPH